MSERTRVREVFATVEADPDAILEEAGVDDPAELIAGGGRHDPVDDETEEATVTDLLGNLQDAAAETRSNGSPADRDPGEDRIETDVAGDAVEIEAGDDIDAESEGNIRNENEIDSGNERPFPDVNFGEPTVTVIAGDGEAIDELLGGELPTPSGRNSSLAGRDSKRAERDSNPAERDSIPTEPDPDPELTLAGGELTVTRVSSDRFGCV